jgi:hypothetical protein
MGSGHYFLYYLVPAMFPRFLITLKEDLTALTTTVRVGQAVDTVGQAGRPKTITGFQTHTTPVLMAYTERAELATEEFLPLSSVLEGFVILKKNPEVNEGGQEFTIFNSKAHTPLLSNSGWTKTSLHRNAQKSKHSTWKVKFFYANSIWRVSVSAILMLSSAMVSSMACSAEGDTRDMVLALFVCFCTLLFSIDLPSNL